MEIRSIAQRLACGSVSLHPPGFIEPCLPTGSRTAPTGPQWAYEIKHDGFRFICRRDGERVRVFSRNGHEWGAQLPAIAAALRALPVRSVILDGEGVICGPLRQLPGFLDALKDGPADRMAT
jgi:bifunctional non-homologous end joining protein LigD